MITLSLMLLSFIAIVVCAVFLRAHATGGTVPGCGAGSGCDAIIASRWSRIGRVPVALLGLALYAAILATVVPRELMGVHSPPLDLFLIAASATIVAGAAWFSILQVGILHRICPACMAFHAVGVVFVAVASTRVNLLQPPPLGIGVGVALGLMVTQTIVRPPQYRVVPAEGPPLAARDDTPSGTSAAPPSGEKDVVLLNGHLRLGISDWPLLGSPGASRVVALLFDPTCDTCRHMYRLLDSAAAASGRGLAVLTIPVPQHSSCNPSIPYDAPEAADACELARLIYAGWRVDPKALQAFLYWLNDPARAPSLTEARSRAHRTFGAGFSMTLLDSSVRSKIQRAVAHQAALQLPGKLPQVLLEDRSLSGKAASVKELLEAIRPHPTPAP
jgi:uncharacterized membrane protein